MLHDEANGIATPAAAKTFVNLFCGWNTERRGFFIMEGAEAKIVRSPFFQLDKSTDYVNNVNSAKYFLYSGLGYHVGQQI